jgi:hypothetical protein
MVDLLWRGMGGAISWVEGLGQSVEQLDVGCTGDMGVNGRVGELFRNSAIRS